MPSAALRSTPLARPPVRIRSQRSWALLIWEVSRSDLEVATSNSKMKKRVARSIPKWTPELDKTDPAASLVSRIAGLSGLSYSSRECSIVGGDRGWKIFFQNAQIRSPPNYAKIPVKRVNRG
jgi:hypothetical protein